MLSYLVTSSVRRDLLQLLWGERAVGSVSSLARRAGVSFSAAHRELEAMKAAGLAMSERSGNRVSYAADDAHPQGDLVEALVACDERVVATSHDQDVRAWLRAVGAPLSTAASPEHPPLAEVVGEALCLAHRDATVARVLPLVLWRHRHADLDALVAEATRRNERQTLGLFLQLAGELGKDRQLVAVALRLHDKRRSRSRPFFAGPHGPRALAAARRNTPAVARKWGFVMNMGRDSFASAFEKHVP
jgi:hypothetical protein